MMLPANVFCTIACNVVVNICVLPVYISQMCHRVTANPSSAGLLATHDVWAVMS